MKLRIVGNGKQWEDEYETEKIEESEEEEVLFEDFWEYRL
jgi:hypothetical protein